MTNVRTCDHMAQAFATRQFDAPQMSLAFLFSIFFVFTAFPLASRHVLLLYLLEEQQSVHSNNGNDPACIPAKLAESCGFVDRSSSITIATDKSLTADVAASPSTCAVIARRDRSCEVIHTQRAKLHVSMYTYTYVVYVFTQRLLWWQLRV